MRVLGYSTISGGDGLISPAPVDCFDYARMAASKMLIPGTAEQPVDERKRMVQEILNAESTEYPSERSYKKVCVPLSSMVVPQRTPRRFPQNLLLYSRHATTHIS